MKNSNKTLQSSRRKLDIPNMPDILSVVMAANENLRGVKTIQYYRKSNYGVTHEYVKDKGDAGIIAQLTGRKTISGVERELIRDLTGGMVTFAETLAP